MYYNERKAIEYGYSQRQHFYFLFIILFKLNLNSNWSTIISIIFDIAVIVRICHNLEVESFFKIIFRESSMYLVLYSNQFRTMFNKKIVKFKIHFLLINFCFFFFTFWLIFRKNTSFYLSSHSDKILSIHR